MMAMALPGHVIQRCVLSAMDPNEFLNLYKACNSDRCAANVHFKQEYLLPAFESISPDKLYSEDYRTMREEIICDLIASASAEEVIAMLDKIEFPYLCDIHASNYIRIWNAVVRRGDTAILDAFIGDCDDCKQCLSDALNSIIDLNAVNMFVHVMRTYGVPSLQHVLRMIIMDDKLMLDKFFEELASNAEMRGRMYDDCDYLLTTAFPPHNSKNIIEVDMVHIHAQSLSYQMRHYRDKHTRLIWKRLRYFQKLVGYAEFADNIFQYMTRIL